MDFKIIFILIIVFILIILIKKESFSTEENIFMPEIYTIANKLGKDYIKNITNLPEKSAVMFDIDDTLLYVNKNKLTPIKPIINLLNYCINKDLLILIITAREQKYREETIRDLNNNNIRYSFLYLRQSPKDDHDYFKSHVKEELYNNYGITTILSVGDNYIDILGSYSGYGIKLPNKNDPKLYETSYDGKNLIAVK
jgi:predicted secreted acid phosphatase